MNEKNLKTHYEDDYKYKQIREKQKSLIMNALRSEERKEIRELIIEFTF